VEVAYLLDVDGVVSDPFEKRVTEPAFFTAFAAALGRGEAVALNTGRSIAWLLERVIEPLRARVPDACALARFAAVGEKGATWAWFDERGAMHRGRADELAVAPSVRDAVRAIVEASYAEWMYFDETKETMVSVELRVGCAPEAFAGAQRRLVRELSSRFRPSLERRELRIDATVIATDLQHGSAGKALGARRFLDLLAMQRRTPERFVAFGDSGSDLEMADELQRQGRRVEFVYVARERPPDGLRKPYPIVYVEPGRAALRHLRYR
jgi:hypothetical protein